MTTVGQRARLASRFAVAVLAAVLVIAILVAIVAPGHTRALLNLPFTGVPSTTGEVLHIFRNNAMLALLAGAGAIVVPAVRRQQCAGASRLNTVLYRTLFDALLAAPTVTTIALVGAGLGAYGARMARSILPHGLLELAAFALVFSVYLDARRSDQPFREVAYTVIVAAALLAIAAPLEVYVKP